LYCNQKRNAMCLYLKEAKLNVAKKDIKCYKVIMRRNPSPVYTTPCRFAPIVFNAVTTAKRENHRVKVDAFDKCVLKFSPFLMIGDGAIHSYKSLTEAKRSAKRFSVSNPYTEYAVAECIIPKGTPYYEGNDIIKCDYVDDAVEVLIDNKQYASHSIIYKEIVEKYKSKK